ncbi:MAG: hypothetical protein E7589_05215 [Ruminococcaceae bacterium]|nr:hypothetical protein [Oscillospiraceae bacterium]
MKRTTIVILTATLSLMYLFLCVGFAAIADDLSIIGTASATATDYDEIVITDISIESGTTASAESTACVIPTNLKTRITGTAGEKIVFKITAHNFSDTETYVYAGITYSQEYADLANKLNITAAIDAAGTQVLPNNTSATYSQGTAVTPDEDFVFYATYTLTESLSSGEIMVNFSFKPIIYTVTYLNNNETYATDHITDNSVAYNVMTDAPTNGSLFFAGWINANAEIVESFPSGNTNDYTLSAKWDNVYLIIFADADGTVLYEENFTDSSTGLSAEGQAIVDEKLAELNTAADGDMTVTWSEYDIANATSDIIVRAIYNYSGYLNMEPVDVEPKDGIIDYYQVLAVDSLPATVEVPGNVGGTPVKVIDRITNVDGESDWNNYENNVTKIIIGEGVEILSHNALSYTPNLSEVSLPSTITHMGKNTFSRNDFLGNDKKKLTITFNGTRAEWKAIVANSDAAWAGGLEKGSTVVCSDGYFECTRASSLFSNASWTEHAS